MDIRQCFEILELDIDVAIDDVHQAYKDLVTVWHPDRFATNSRLKKKAEAKLKMLNQAYEEVLFFLSSENAPQKAERSSGSGTYAISNSSLKEPVKEIFERNRSNPPKSETTADFRPRPWVRCFARLIDYLLFGFFLILIGADGLIMETGIYVLIIPTFLALAWIIPEAGLLSMFGATPGKWILKTQVVDIFKLKPKFSSTLRRSLSVWCNGMGMGVLFIAPITALFSYFRIKRKGCTVWDRDGRFSVKHQQIGIPRVLVAFLSLSVLIFFIFFGPNIMIAAYRQAVRMKPDEPKTHLNLGASYVKVGRYNEAIEAYRHALKIEPDYALAYYNLGRCYAELKRYDEALSSFEKAVKIEPHNAEMLYALGVCYARLDLPDKAVETFEKAIKIEPDYVEALQELGVCNIELERYDEAMEASKKVIQIKPDYAPAHYNLGICYSRLRRTEEAIRSFKESLKINPDDEKAHYNLGLCYVYLGRYQDAREPFEKVIEIEPNNAKALYDLGVCYAKVDLPVRAVEVLKQAVRIKPDYAQAYHILGLAYLTINDKKSAHEQYNMLRNLDKGLAAELLAYIENLPTE